ncbi:MAG: hypothetical protein AB4040_20330, partial [Synechococcus sp.]
VCPCLKLVVIVSRLLFLSSIWTLVLRQETFTPLVHAHAGRTHAVAADAEGMFCESQGRKWRS